MKKILVSVIAMTLGVASSVFAAEINDQLEINGEIRANYLTMKAAVNGKSYESYLRTRLKMVYKPTEDWKIVAMAENTHDLREKRGYRHHDIVLKQAYVKGKYDQIYVTTGRCMISIGNGNVFEDDSDILIIGHNINDKVKLEALLAQNLGGHRLQLGDTKSKLIGSRLTYAPVENTTIKAEYASFRDLGYKDFDDVGHSVNMDIFAISTSTKVAKNLKANAVYIRGNAKTADTDLKATSKNGYVAGLAYKGANAEKKGSWGVNVNYYNQGAQSYIDHAIEGNTDVLTSINLINRSKNLVLIDGNMSFPSGFKGWSISTDWVLVKNLVAKLAYYDTKDKEGGTSDRRVWSSLTWSF